MTLSKRTWLILTVAVTAALFCAATVQAKKPDNPGGGNGGGGKGAGQNGGGVIYYRYHGDIYTMNDDGSGVEVVADFPAGFSGWGEPSYQPHAEKRWFLQTYDVSGEFYPDFHPDGTLKDFANRRVFYALSDAGDPVELPIPADLEPLGAKWTIDDGYVSFPGRLWDSNLASPTYGSVLEGGLYRTEINFDQTTGDITGTGTSELAFPLSLVPSNANRQSNDLTPGPDILNFDWAPDGKQFVFDSVAGHELRIGNVDNADTGELQVLFDDPDRRTNRPLWSPAGDNIMFNYPAGWTNYVMSINPDGSGLKQLVGSTPNWSLSTGVWSPTGSHLLFQHFDHFLSDSHIVRAKANGSRRTRLTGAEIGDFSGPLAIGWRDVPTAALAGYTSIPEPSSLMLGALALTGLLAGRRSAR
jgi:hypothetical protein